MHVITYALRIVIIAFDPQISSKIMRHFPVLNGGSVVLFLLLRRLNSILLIVLIPMFISAIIQRLIFRSACIALKATFMLAFLAHALSSISLRGLEDKVQSDLNLPGFGPQPMFRKAEQSA
jgi:hypothetical protein